jgi:tRNA A-37 threonylcarbamoyl transferase component Bud32
MENVPLFANSYDPDIQARLLSEQLEAAVEAEEEAKAVAQAGTSHPIGGSYGKKMPDANNSNITMKKAKSYQALEDLEKKGYFPSAPKPSAQGVQRGLKDSVVNDMCRAVVKHMVGDIYVPASSQYGAKKVLNHLYEPVLVSVQSHFKRLPARYALSVNPDDVPMHMRLLAKHQRNPQELNINVQLKKEDDGSITPNIYEVLVVSIDRNSLLDAITRALTSMKGSIMDADVMTTHDGVTLDRFVVKGSFMTEDRQKQLKARIEENLARLSLGEEDFPSEEVTKNKQDQTKVKEVEKEIEGAIKATQHKSENVGLAEKLGVLKMVGDNNIKAEWKLEMAEIRLSEPIGSGRSGQTYSAYWRGTKVAAKVVDSSKHSRSMGEDLLNEFHREVAVVSKLRHPNIVLFLGAAIAPPRYCLVFEFMENGTLTDLIRSRKAPIDFFRISKEIAMGMNYLHLCSIMHRDLKSGNVLLDTHGTVKISDFGLSCVLEIGSASSELTAETGTYRWMAPEVIRHEPYSNKADVYSFGVVLWEMIAKDQPFRGMTPIQGKLLT